MKKNRTKIPLKIADDVMFKSDRLCPICYDAGHQIHHIDGDSSNNELDNLILLCFKHHHEANSTSHLSRKLSRGLLRRYRNEHYENVALKRNRQRGVVNTQEGIPRDDDVGFQAALDAVVCVEVEKINTKLNSRDWKSIQDVIYNLNSFPPAIGFRARASILDVLYTLSGKTRDKVPLLVAEAVHNVTVNILPIRSFSETQKVPISESDQQLFRTGLHIGFNIAHDAVKYLHDIKIVNEGIQIMWQVLSYSHLNKVLDLEKHAVEEFSRLEEVAKLFHDESSEQLIFIYRNQGISGSFRFPDFPNELIKKLVS